KPSNYDEKDVELLTYVADIVWTIVERKQAQEALLHYAKQLAVQNAELDAFAHTVAHDLKSPLGTITGFAQLLVNRYETMSPENITEAAQYIFRTGQKLNTIIEELMLLAGVRKQEVIPEPLDMHNIIREAINRLQMLIQDQQAQITLRDEAAWPDALGYTPWIEEVWANYIGNAIKYGGQPPNVELGAAMQADSKVRFWVRDNGPGLSAEAQAKLFTPFTQLSQVRANGHGLGLSIVRRIVEKLGGQVGLESESGQGSTFFFILPAWV
ncbi:MAG TPA: HAMP domain-containing histidine kinase, partial [Chloroflexi bacterium]|nr:HAMP domain-containing histidine kinase [Chloroflexota bacterium]